MKKKKNKKTLVDAFKETEMPEERSERFESDEYIEPILARLRQRREIASILIYTGKLDFHDLKQAVDLLKEDALRDIEEMGIDEIG